MGPWGGDGQPLGRGLGGGGGPSREGRMSPRPHSHCLLTRRVACFAGDLLSHQGGGASWKSGVSRTGAAWMLFPGP